MQFNICTVDVAVALAAVAASTLLLLLNVAGVFVNGI